ncbi:MAG: DNA cytosine methyltransferase [Alphaproteobacteria bacterium]|nr:DNA cytosine methyltransferase [Alphaproteobacteria bacterium]
MRRPIGIDLFAGAGGLSLGFEQAGFDVVAAVEIDPIHCATHEFNFPLCKTICRSVAEVSGDEIRKLSRIGRSDIDVVFGGAPCQGFSMIGKRALDDPRNHLVHHFLRIVLELQPKYFVFENVKGLTVGQHRRFLDELIEAFEDEGYEIVKPYRVLNAAEFGVPQDRRRLFLIGARKGYKLPRYPQEKYYAAGSHAIIGRVMGPTTWGAIGDLPEVEEYPILFQQDWIRTEFGEASAYGRSMRGLSNEPEDYSYRRNYDRDILTSSMRAEHTAVSRRRFAETPLGETEPVSRFHKLNPDGVCNTLRAGTASDRGAFTSPRPIHPFTPRCITVREAARLHSYPDWFRFHVTKWHGFRQIGNSVPPLLGRAVASQVIALLDGTPSTPTTTTQVAHQQLLTLSMAEAADFWGVPHNVIPKRVRGGTEDRAYA